MHTSSGYVRLSPVGHTVAAPRLGSWDVHLVHAQGGHGTGRHQAVVELDEWGVMLIEANAAPVLSTGLCVKVCLTGIT